MIDDPMKIKKIKNKRIWEKFVLNTSQGNFLQSWNWGEFNQNLNNKIFRLGFFQNNKLVGVCLLIKKEAKRGSYLECPAGPLIDWSQPILFQKFVDQLKTIGKIEKCHFVRVRPQILNSLINKTLFKNNGFISAPMHLHAETTWQINIDKTEERLLKEMRKNTRYLVKKAIKLNIQVKTSVDLKDIALLYNLQIETANRHHFVPFSFQYFLEEFKSFVKNKQAVLFKSIWKNEVTAIALVIFYGEEAIYHYAASSSKFSKIPISYALQWAIIKEAKKRNIKIYNLWGIAPTDNSKHRFRGVTIFKKGFGGVRVDYLHAQDLVLKKTYWLNYIFEKIRKFHRHL